jgi:hypothetical protein
MKIWDQIEKFVRIRPPARIAAQPFRRFCEFGSPSEKQSGQTPH